MKKIRNTADLRLQQTIFLSAFQPEDQAAVKALILSGLQDHWGSLDLTKNPDLNDIAASYRGAVFLVARQHARVIGSGALVPRSPEVGEVVRMSVASELRGQGIGSQILTELLRQARGLGLKRVILETTETWAEVITFYQHHGFQISHYQDGDVYFSLDLA